MKIIENIIGFDWDKGNIDKNYIKHNVHWTECEEVFFNEPIIVENDIKHSSKNEVRYFVVGKTNSGRKLFLVHTIRNNKIRVISARDMNKKEREIYEKIEKNSRI